MSFDPTLGNVSLFDETGNRVRDIRIILPDADLERINDTAVSRDGRLAVAVAGYTRDGKFVKAIAFVNSAGEMVKVVRTSPFAVRQLSFAEDGTLWTLGDIYDDTFTNKTVPPYDILWKFDAHGARMRTALNSATFNTKHQVAAHSHLAISPNKIGVYCELTNVWVEVSFSGESLGKWTVPIPSGSWVRRVALTSSGDVLIQELEEQPGRKNSALQAYLFDKQAGRLTPMDLSAIGGGHPTLLGTNGDRLAWQGWQSGSRRFVLANISR